MCFRRTESACRPWNSARSRQSGRIAARFEQFPHLLLRIAVNRLGMRGQQIGRHVRSSCCMPGTSDTHLVRTTGGRPQSLKAIRSNGLLARHVQNEQLDLRWFHWTTNHVPRRLAGLRRPSPIDNDFLVGAVTMAGVFGALPGAQDHRRENPDRQSVATVIDPDGIASRKRLPVLLDEATPFPIQTPGNRIDGHRTRVCTAYGKSWEHTRLTPPSTACSMR